MYIDTVIVGGGPAAVMAALELEKRNIDYVIIYPKNYSKICGGLLTPETVEWLKKRNLSSIIDNSLTTPSHLDLLIVDHIAHKTTRKKKYIINIDRYKFDEELREKIDNKRKINGAVTNIKNMGGLFNIYYTNSMIKSKHLIYAIGPNSKFLNKMPQITIQHHYEISGKNIKEVIFILHEKIKEFYIWVIPKDNNLIIGSLNKYKMLMEPIVEETLKGLGYDIRLDKIVKKEGYLLALPNQPKDIICSHNNIIFAGESANFVSRKSGKGIYYALISGELAGKYYDSPVLYSNAVKPLMDKLIKKMEEAKSIYL